MQAQYLDVMESNPSFRSPTNGGSLAHPVETVSWEDANLFCQILTQRERLEGTIRPNERYRLPTEAEWEYAARAGTSSRFYFADLDECELDKSEPCPTANGFIWWTGNASQSTHPVSQLAGSTWGLFDMYGNVGEWCVDGYETFTNLEVTNPTGEPTISVKIVRGGDWNSRLVNCRSAARGRVLQATTAGNFGFRVVLAVDSEDVNAN